MRKFIVCIVLLMTVTVTSALSQDDRLIVKKDPADAKRLICELKLATFKVPEGWQPNRSDGKTQCILTKASEKQSKDSPMIMIDVGKPANPSAKELAKSFAKSLGGKVSETSIKVDGQEAWSVSIPPTDKKVQPTNAVFVIKDSTAFMLIAGSKTDEKLDKVLEQLTADWHWK